MRLRYQLPIRCPCGENFNMQRAMSSKKGRFVTLRDSKLREITNAWLEEVCHDVVIEPILQPVIDNNFVPSWCQIRC